MPDRADDTSAESLPGDLHDFLIADEPEEQFWAGAIIRAVTSTPAEAQPDLIPSDPPVDGLDLDAPLADDHDATPEHDDPPNDPHHGLVDPAADHSWLSHHFDTAQVSDDEPDAPEDEPWT